MLRGDKKFLLELYNYCGPLHDYFLKWTLSLKESESFTLMLLNTIPAWEQVESLYGVEGGFKN